MAKRQKPNIRDEDYAVTAKGSRRRIAAPELPYRPPRPRRAPPGIGVIGCGGIIASHLRAYRKAGYPVIALTDLDLEKAEAVRKRFAPGATVCRSAEELLARTDVGVVDIATHPGPRVALMQQAIARGKHVLSQKPFVEDLAVGRRLVAKAKRKGVRLAVNQNGRWAPHVGYARAAIAAGVLGDVMAVDLSVHWDHNWCAGTPFDRIRHLALYDFGIHWFDMIHCYLREQRPQTVFAAVTKSRTQRTRPPLLAQAVIRFPRAQASLLLRADTRWGPQDRTVIVGTRGTLVSEGRDLNHQKVTLYLENGIARPKLATRWFDDGFDGTMSELLCAIEERREPSNSAADNLKSLALCFAAMASADRGEPVPVRQTASGAIDHHK